MADNHIAVELTTVESVHTETFGIMYQRLQKLHTLIPVIRSNAPQFTISTAVWPHSHLRTQPRRTELSCRFHPFRRGSAFFGGRIVFKVLRITIRHQHIAAFVKSFYTVQTVIEHKTGMIRVNFADYFQRLFIKQRTAVFAFRFICHIIGKKTFTLADCFGKCPEFFFLLFIHTAFEFAVSKKFDLIPCFAGKLLGKITCSSLTFGKIFGNYFFCMFYISKTGMQGQDIQRFIRLVRLGPAPAERKSFHAVNVGYALFIQPDFTFLIRQFAYAFFAGKFFTVSNRKNILAIGKFAHIKTADG